MFTDNLVAKIPSTASGTVKAINFKGEDVCAVGHTLMTIELDDGVEAEVAKPKHAETPIQAAAPKEVSNPGPGNNSLSKALSTPAVRHIAKKEGIDINKVPGTGKGGRVTKEDLVNFMSGKSAKKQDSSSSESDGEQ